MTYTMESSGKSSFTSQTEKCGPYMAATRILCCGKTLMDIFLIFSWIFPVGRLHQHGFNQEKCFGKQKHIAFSSSKDIRAIGATEVYLALIIICVHDCRRRI